jgi:hypothetical protein
MTTASPRARVPSALILDDGDGVAAETETRGGFELLVPASDLGGMVNHMTRFQTLLDSHALHRLAYSVPYCVSLALWAAGFTAYVLAFPSLVADVRDPWTTWPLLGNVSFVAVELLSRFDRKLFWRACGRFQTWFLLLSCLVVGAGGGVGSWTASASPPLDVLISATYFTSMPLSIFFDAAPVYPNRLKLFVLVLQTGVVGQRLSKMGTFPETDGICFQGGAVCLHVRAAVTAALINIFVFMVSYAVRAYRHPGQLNNVCARVDVVTHRNLEVGRTVTRALRSSPANATAIAVPSPTAEGAGRRSTRVILVNQRSDGAGEEGEEGEAVAPMTELQVVRQRRLSATRRESSQLHLRWVLVESYTKFLTHHDFRPVVTQPWLVEFARRRLYTRALRPLALTAITLSVLIGRFGDGASRVGQQTAATWLAVAGVPLALALASLAWTQFDRTVLRRTVSQFEVVYLLANAAAHAVCAAVEERRGGGVSTEAVAHSTWLCVLLVTAIAFDAAVCCSRAERIGVTVLGLGHLLVGVADFLWVDSGGRPASPALPWASTSALFLTTAANLAIFQTKTLGKTVMHSHTLSTVVAPVHVELFDS